MMIRYDYIIGIAPLSKKALTSSSQSLFVLFILCDKNSSFD